MTRISLKLPFDRHVGSLATEPIVIKACSAARLVNACEKPCSSLPSDSESSSSRESETREGKGRERERALSLSELRMCSACRPGSRCTQAACDNVPRRKSGTIHD